MIVVFDSNEKKLGLMSSIDSEPEWHNIEEGQTFLSKMANAVKKEDINHIIVIQGKGGFSQTREASVVSSIMSIYGQIPVISVTDEQFASKSFKLEDQKRVDPDYFAEPTINT